MLSSNTLGHQPGGLRPEPWTRTKLCGQHFPYLHGRDCTTQNYMGRRGSTQPTWTALLMAEMTGQERAHKETHPNRTSLLNGGSPARPSPHLTAHAVSGTVVPAWTTFFSHCIPQATFPVMVQRVNSSTGWQFLPNYWKLSSVQYEASFTLFQSKGELWGGGK